MAKTAVVRSWSEIKAECPLYRGSGVNRHRWVTDVDIGPAHRDAPPEAELHFYVGHEGWDPVTPEIDADAVFCRYCGILAVE